MKTIVEGNSNVIKLLGKQRLNDTLYRKMNYVLKKNCRQGVLLHNSITGKLVLLSGAEAALLEELPAKYTEKMNELVEDYYLVPVSYNEKKTVETLRCLLKRLLEKKGIENYTILTTTNCNARCFYCYESNLPHINMEADTAKKLVEYMANNKQCKSLKLHWFGGEPLVGIKRIDQICEDLTERGIAFISTMTSNGYLFSEPIVKRAVESWKLDSVQITLDGTEEVYNRTKAYVGVNGSPFLRVLNNIKLLLDHGIQVIIRLNLDKHNNEDLNMLIDELEEIFNNHERIEVYTHTLFEDAGFAPIERDEGSRNSLYSRQIELNSKLEKMGLQKRHRSLPFVKTHNCMADTDNSVVVYPDGRIFKCEHVEIGDEAGSITTEDTVEYGIKKFQITTELSECSECPIYPSCILLKNCAGILDKNTYTCNYDVEQYKKALVKHYDHYTSTLNI